MAGISSMNSNILFNQEDVWNQERLNKSKCNTLKKKAIFLRSVFGLPVGDKK